MKLTISLYRIIWSLISFIWTSVWSTNLRSSEIFSPIVWSNDEGLTLPRFVRVAIAFSNCVLAKVICAVFYVSFIAIALKFIALGFKMTSFFYTDINIRSRWGKTSPITKSIPLLHGRSCLACGLTWLIAFTTVYADIFYSVTTLVKTGV